MTVIKKRKYSFISRWQIKAPIEVVWDAFYESEHWPKWWKGVSNVEEIAKGNVNGIGSIRNYTIISPALYRLRFSLMVTDKVDYLLLKGKVSGDLEGTGAWFFNEKDGVTYLECHWAVSTNIPWMNMLASVLAPFFRYNHSRVMKNGAIGLSKKLKTELIFAD